MDTGEAVAPPGVSSPGRGVTPIALISNMGPMPAALMGTTEQKADEFVRRVDFAMAQFAEPVIVNGLLRRHFVAKMTGLGRNSQPAVLKYLEAQGAIELKFKDGEQWLRRPPNGEGTITDASAVAEPDALTYTSAVAEPVARMGVTQLCAKGG